MEQRTSVPVRLPVFTLYYLLNTNICIVLIAYHLQKMPYVFPLVGGHKIEQLISNIDALRLVLTEAHIKEIEDAVPFDLGYPHKYIVSEKKKTCSKSARC